MFNTKFLISTVIFVFFLIITSIVKNQKKGCTCRLRNEIWKSEYSKKTEKVKK